MFQISKSRKTLSLALLILLLSSFLYDVQCPKSRKNHKASLYDDQDPGTFDSQGTLYEGEKTIRKIKNSLKQVDEELSKGLIFNKNSEKQMETLIYFMGITGVGKSSLINYLLGNQLIYEKQGGGRFKIVQKNLDSYSPKIGSTQHSETVIPEAYRDPEQNVLYVDTPGFMNSKGIVEEISDSYANSRVFIKGNKIKIALVLDYQTLLAGRGQFLVKSAKKIKQLFPKEFKGIYNSMAVIVTKVNPEEERVMELIEEIKKDSENYEDDQQILTLFDSILRNERIYLVPLPSHPSILKYISDIKEELNSIKAHELRKNAKLSLSAEARILVEKLGQSIQRYVESSHDKVQSLIRNKFKKYVEMGQRDIKSIKSAEIVSIIKQLLEMSEQLSSSTKLTPQQEKKFLDFAGISDTNTQDQLLKNIDYLRYCNSLHQYVNVGDFFYDISDTLLSLIGELKITLEKIQNSESLERMEKNHQESITKVQKQVNEKYDKKMEEAKSEYNLKVKELRSEMSAESESKIKILRQNHEKNMKILKDNLSFEQEKQKKQLEKEFEERYQQMREQMEKNSQEEINLLKTQLENARQREWEARQYQGGGQDNGLGILNTIISGVFSIVPSLL